MANRAEHELIGALAGGLLASCNEEEANKYAINPVTGAVIGKFAARLPDLLEPAHHPNHRNFCHSWFAIGLCGVGAYNLWHWKPEEEHKKIFKWVLLLVGAAYASHLLRDSITPKGLPAI